ncbi:MAG TPA: prepilin-type N-terminal cleavage/methylation domain-containing protein [Nitrospiraceae bacterium]|nr:prepilin-type N-terminal cleavage/methylation domain-containing protein [Nitrospiraceae bacterium]
MKPRAIDRIRTMRGFTLTEMMVVVGIIALLSAFAIPNYLDWQRKYRLKDSIAFLQSSLALARMIAMNQNTTVTVTISQPSATSAVTVAFTKSAGGGTKDVMPPMTLPPSTGFTSSAAGEISLTNTGGGTVASPQDIQFTALGRPVNPSTTPNAANNLCINSTGAYTACSGGTAQAVNLKNSKGLNYRVVVGTTGKLSWCYATSCAS